MNTSTNPFTEEEAEMDAVAKTTDVNAQPGPNLPFRIFPNIENHRAFREAIGGSLSDVKWPSKDSNSPDYSYIADASNPKFFELSPVALDKLMRLNFYDPHISSGILSFALRGARLIDIHQAEMVDAVTLENVRPNHRDFRCIIGFYFVEQRKLSVYTGSTVPCRLAVFDYANGGGRSNLLPTGLHTMHVWRHKNLRPALRMSKSSADLENGAEATVLRNTNDLTIGTRDKFDLSTPYDNVHCSYYTSYNSSLGAYFSSWGCLTVRGKKTPTEQWKRFQDVLRQIGPKARVDLLLATGKDLAVISSSQESQSNVDNIMLAIRRGSMGEKVRALQVRMGFDENQADGIFGAYTLKQFTALQRTLNSEIGNGPIADGIYSKSMDALTGWDILVD